MVCGFFGGEGFCCLFGVLFVVVSEKFNLEDKRERECSHSLDVAELEAIRNLRIYHWDSLMVGVTSCVTCPVASISSAFPACA